MKARRKPPTRPDIRLQLTLKRPIEDIPLANREESIYASLGFRFQNKAAGKTSRPKAGQTDQKNRGNPKENPEKTKNKTREGRARKPQPGSKKTNHKASENPATDGKAKRNAAKKTAENPAKTVPQNPREKPEKPVHDSKNPTDKTINESDFKTSHNP